MNKSYCPDCGDPLKALSKVCACGWSAKPLKTSEGSIKWDGTCTWEYHGNRCRFVCGRFDTGSTSGFCILHRLIKDKENCVQEAADVVEWSRIATYEQFMDVVKERVYGYKSESDKRLFDRAKEVAKNKPTLKMGLANE